MKLKYHLLIALVLVVVALFLTSVVSNTDALGIEKESETQIWSLMWENLFTDIPTEEFNDTLMEAGVPETISLGLIEEHGTGTDFLTGLLGLLPVLGALAALVGLALLVHKQKLIKGLLYGSFGAVLVGVVTLWFTAPSKLNGIESLYNTMYLLNPTLPTTMGTMMADGTTFSMGLGLLFGVVGSLYGIVALVLNQYGKIAE